MHTPDGEGDGVKQERSLFVNELLKLSARRHVVSQKERPAPASNNPAFSILLRITQCIMQVNIEIAISANDYQYNSISS
jgi:hypothetical protein